MAEGNSQVLEELWFQYGNTTKIHDQNENCISSSESSVVEDSAFSNESSSSSSLETADDVTSSASSSLSADSSGGSYDLTDLMEELPIKRGLSKFYEGKSESFTSLSMVTSLEDLVKKGAPYKRKMKASKSYAAGLNSFKPYTLPKPIISKKSPKASFSSSFPSKKGNIIKASPR
ncbi:uncharacterized protein LOC111410409 [Olea europaea var. sylvestris]|uniref:Oxidative stress 3 n=1 Tax=Olea europaea subsp. europaea TaxID=158383 RepID=A0A8S0P6S6_OLEEU|nr:uncharacterized protein LOC111410409 [Olea europaea var. sylvestris]CAA2933426.1 Hypothetical predicted protein [Olea europaea subsp. europaea]